MKWKRGKADGESGQSMVEFVIVFPVLFLFFLMILQTALLLNARHLVHYAAFYAARAAIVWPEGERKKKAERAAVIACLPISPKLSGVFNVDIPSSLGNIVSSVDRYPAAKALTSVDLKLEPAGDVTAEVTHHYAMRIPIINRIFFEVMLKGKVPDELQNAIAFLGALVDRKTVSRRMPWEALKSEIPGIAPFYPLTIKARSTLTIEKEYGAKKCCK